MIILTLLTYVSSALAAECIQELTDQNVTGSKLLGGFFVKEGLYPFVVAIVKYEEHVCGGTILSPKFVITAAHCVAATGHYAVIAGTVDLDFQNHKRKIEKIILHPQYEFDHKSGELVYNLAVAELESILPLYPDKITAIKLPLDSSDVPFECGTALGWGLTYFGSIFPKTLLEAVRMFRESCDVAEYYFCIGHRYEPRDFCDADAGGPFMINGTLYGVMSHNQADFCGMGLPSVLVNVPYFVGWIKEAAQLK